MREYQREQSPQQDSFLRRLVKKGVFDRSDLHFVFKKFWNPIHRLGVSVYNYLDASLDVVLATFILISRLKERRRFQAIRERHHK